MNIEKYLILNRYLLSLFGASEFRDLQKELAEKPVGYDSDGQSYFVNILRSLDGLNRDRLPEEKLLVFDENIQGYLRKINEKREPKIILKYFQYLAVLFTEIYLDELKNRKAELLGGLNAILAECRERDDLGDRIGEFTEPDLCKLAFWMATGSGKTLILHINYHQFMRYKAFAPDSIILITPNEGLSRQHFEELQKSGIPCRLYSGSLSDMGGGLKERGVLILEMTKLVEEKKGSGVTIPVDVFEGRNLLFVDEGHKGKKSEEQKWAKLRDKVAEKGFVFEYSATFGQILNESNRQTLEEYGKAILFDYSYKYFYLDGYGKDFSVVNVKTGNIGGTQFQETMFVANLLAFYQQLCVYEDQKAMARLNNLEKPLWIFVGTTVNEEESDILQILELFLKAVHDEAWLERYAERILSGKSGLKKEDGADAFEGSFEYVEEIGLSMEDLYRRVLGGKGQFSVHEIRGAEGELALKVGENPYFGVVNVGSTVKLRKELEKKGVVVGVDAITGSLFDTIKKEDSPTNVLIGSKKFIEGWDTWRVSSMGLLNMGTGQGPQIIQLFGRGIRIKGQGYSLKRSNGKGHLKYLEALHVFGIKADYLNRFLDAIRKEDVEFVEIDVPVVVEHKDKWKRLYSLSKDASKKFEEHMVVTLRVDGQTFVSLNLMPKVTMYLGGERKPDGPMSVQNVQVVAQEQRLPEGVLGLLDWNRIIREISDFRTARGYWNLVFGERILRDILLSEQYKVSAPEGYFSVTRPEDISRLEEAAIQVLKKYTERFYRDHAKRFESKHMRYEQIQRQDALFAFDKGNDEYKYTVTVRKDDHKLIEAIRGLIGDINRLRKDDEKVLRRVYFDRHLYLPILLQDKNIERISPAALVDSESDFISRLRQYLKEKKELLASREVYLLRNQPKTGVGFFNLSGFYPDFIMWIVDEAGQRIVFLDPHGLEHEKPLSNEKIQLYKEIKDLEIRLDRKDVTLDSFILSKTTYQDLIKGDTEPRPLEEWEAHHVLFMDDNEWPRKLFSSLLGAGITV
jgi:superfamily II DNA or RNA helicase